MKTRPILFSGPMVKALLADQKTQTRRLVTPQPELIDARSGGKLWHLKTRHGFINSANEHAFIPGMINHSGGADIPPVCPYGQPGDSLWVRETWRAWPLVGAGDLWRIEYQADGATCSLLVPSNWKPPKTLDRHPVPWVPSIFMPLWASRLTLEVTEIRVQRLHSISTADAIAEGVTLKTDGHDPRDAYAWLWTDINGQASWDANPWVWAISFRVVPRECTST